MLLEELLPTVKTPSAKELAKKHKVPLKKIRKAIKKGTKIEKEHTSKSKIAAEIARDHVGEDPKYYKKLAKIEK